MSAANRIPGKGRLTPALTARFTIDGRTLTAYEGDTVASAMIANGMHLAGRSFKYHRPRGVLGAGVDEPNALVTVLRGEAREHVVGRARRPGADHADRAAMRPGALGVDGGRREHCRGAGEQRSSLHSDASSLLDVRNRTSPRPR